MIRDEKINLQRESPFNFKYIPTLTRTTRLGQSRATKFKRPGIQSLAGLGLVTAFAVTATFGIGLIFAARMLLSNHPFLAVNYQSHDHAV